MEEVNDVHLPLHTMYIYGVQTSHVQVDVNSCVPTWLSITGDTSMAPCTCTLTPFNKWWRRLTHDNLAKLLLKFQKHKE